MNAVMFSPAFAQLVGAPTVAGDGAPLGGVKVARPAADEVRLRRPGLPPLVFCGHLLIDDAGEHAALKLYEADDGGLVCIFDLLPAAGGAARRIFTAASPDELADDITMLDPLRLIDATVPGDASGQDMLRLLHLRIEAVRAALLRLSDVLNVDVSDAIARLAALCDGDQTWLQ